MRKFLMSHKQIAGAIILVAFAILALIWVGSMFGCFGCSSCGGCNFWSCFESVTDSCTDCIGCALGCD